MDALRLPAAEEARIARAWEVLGTVLDPEVPALSVCDLGIVREILPREEGFEIVLTPTYSGCPATEVIERSVLEAIDAAGLGPARVTLRRAPAWTTDWISSEGKRKLREYGIAPPGAAGSHGGAVPIRLVRRPPAAPVACPRCGSAHTERLSAFGSTACKSLYRCLDCREPFEHFKPL
ncbi:1,2-phenylacetyl-CoA monooxygenase, subunit D [Variovorax sp. PBL-H6]|uniref:1,2-phenylacetyl-CoA epoxidase subunit PaaD n=1 Tax=Variovorax sp. PBL-H6 TaxID=434009 RepID=UPI0013196E92|nr:1,2-phenylacetyl-CoA epoxidase subunit PaaD [Variovorax sp. PBL-H6]VTU35023.1 1,2-phenylacetyl-CoA monooxygenase, subunit D [Variovorax sp. PBL-H6]